METSITLFEFQKNMLLPVVPASSAGVKKTLHCKGCVLFVLYYALHASECTGAVWPESFPMHYRDETFQSEKNMFYTVQGTISLYCKFMLF